MRMDHHLCLNSSQSGLNRSLNQADTTQFASIGPVGRRVFCPVPYENFLRRPDLTPLSGMPHKEPGDCFSPENSNFGLSIQIFDSKGIHLFHRRCRHSLRTAHVATSS